MLSTMDDPAISLWRDVWERRTADVLKLEADVRTLKAAYQRLQYAHEASVFEKAKLNATLRVREMQIRELLDEKESK